MILTIFEPSEIWNCRVTKGHYGYILIRSPLNRI